MAVFTSGIDDRIIFFNFKSRSIDLATFVVVVVVVEEWFNVSSSSG